MPDRLLITAASASYGPTLLALLGSLRLNWTDAPEVLVYDLGLDERTRGALAEVSVEVKAVPPFVPHWRRHFTWKFWCWNDAPSRDVFYLDAGIVVLRPLEEVFRAVEALKYFAIPTYHLLSSNASKAACHGCGVDPAFREGRMTIAGNVVAFRKDGAISQVIEEGLAVASTEQHIAASAPMHRHDQAILSLLLHKRLGHPVLADGGVYGGWLSPDQTPGQGLWVHRRRLKREDEAHFASHIGRSGEPYHPSPPDAPSIRDRLSILRRRLQSKGPEIYDGVRD